jgi:hypothetical protein
VSLTVGLVLVVSGLVFAVVQLAPCVFADSRAPTEGIIALAERWLEVEEPVPDGPGIMSDGSGNKTVELSVRHLGTDGEASSAVIVEDIAIHDTLLRQIPPALDERSRVFLALTSEGLVRESVAYLLARHIDGTHAFLTGCAIDLTSEARALLGSRYEVAMRRIIGLSGPEAIYRVLAGVRDAPGRVLVEYEEAPPELRMFSRTGTLVERGRCLAVETDVGPLVPIVDDYYFLARDDEGLVLMSEMYKNARPGDAVELTGREMSPDEALAVTDRASIRSCPGRLMLVTSIHAMQASPG